MIIIYCSWLTHTLILNAETAKKAREAGADVIVAATAIFDSDNIEEAIKNLQ